MRRPLRRAYLVDGLVVAAVLGSIGVAVFAGNRGGAPSDCGRAGTDHRLQLAQDTFSRPAIALERCDRLVIENKDIRSYNLNFGEITKHVKYPGYEATTLLPNESITINAVQAGQYELHDHFRDNAVLRLDVR